jgi:predicted O-methyltransferase YrrM
VIQDDISAVARTYWPARHTIDGALWDADFLLLDRVLSQQGHGGAGGDLLEIGAYLGKSAILLGLHARPDEQVHICDPFDDEGVDAANAQENAVSYSRLTRQGFEDNYRRFVPKPAHVIQEFSTGIRSHLADASLRFAHVDGGHLYNVVKDDIDNIQPLLNEAGVVVFDDFRAIHTPGVAAAVWRAVATQGLVPFCLSEQKLYASWQPDVAREQQAALQEWVSGHAEVRHGTQRIAGYDVLIVANLDIPTRRSRIKSLVPPVIAARLSTTPALHLGE